MKTVALVVSILLMLPGIALGDIRPYLGAEVGAVVVGDYKLIDPTGDTATLSTKTGYGIGGLVGLDAGMFRGEFELMYRENEFDKLSYHGQTGSVSGDLELTSYMVNLYYTPVKETELVKPFFMAGGGLASMTFNRKLYGGTVTISNSNDKPAYQFGAGISLALTPYVSVDLSYRYLGAEDFNLDGMKVSYGAHNFLTGVRVTLH